MTAFLHLLCHDLRLLARQGGEWTALVAFFVIVLVLLPFAIGPDAALLSRIAPGIIWLAALLMILLSLDRLFVADARDGTLDLMLLAPTPLAIIVFARLLAHMVVVLLVLVIMTPMDVLLMSLPPAVVPVMLLTFLLGVPPLILLGGIGGAVTVALQRNVALLTLLMVPFYIPILIFAVAACDAAVAGENVMPHLLLMGALTVVLLPAAPFVIGAALRQGQG